MQGPGSGCRTPAGAAPLPEPRGTGPPLQVVCTSLVLQEIDGIAPVVAQVSVPMLNEHSRLLHPAVVTGAA